MLYPQNGDRIVAIDSVTSLHPMYTACQSLGQIVGQQRKWGGQGGQGPGGPRKARMLGPPSLWQKIDLPSNTGIALSPAQNLQVITTHKYLCCRPMGVLCKWVKL